MNGKTLLYAGGAFAVAAMLFGWFKPAAAAGAGPTGGADFWLTGNARQTGAVDQAISDQWKHDLAMLDKTQPDWWV
jgi:hypothetical protein